MPCNLNFNQCNLGCSFPRPIFNCCSRFISILNQSNIEVINPTIDTSFAISTVTTPQTVGANANLIPVVALNQGSSISFDNFGTYSLSTGRYLISFNINGVYANNGSYSFAVFENESQIAGSAVTSTGTAGNAVSISNSIFLDVTLANALINFKNINTDSQVVNSATISIQKIN